VSCQEKHIVIPIPDEEWFCPSCGDKDNFYIDESATLDEDCALSHPKDVVICYKCNNSWTLQTIINKWAKKKNMVKCECCKGTGWVEGKHEAP
jgi:hypothetical protein